MTGRPPISQRRSIRIKFMATPDLAERIAAAAQADGRSVSDWVQRACEAVMNDKQRRQRR